jgi:SLT domain-containing protein
MTFKRAVRSGLTLGALVCFPALTLRADFSYEQTSKITGGAMASMMKVAGVFSKSAREPVRTSVVVKGDRMANLTPDSASIIDLSAETITEVNFKQKQYSVVTFAEMAKFLDLMAQKTAKETGGKADVSFRASVKETGKTQTISGLSTREVILTLVMEGEDKESGQKGSMNVTSTMWLARDVPGYQEVRAFQQKMAQKIAWTPGGSAFAQGRGDIAKGFADLQKEASKLDGVPVLQTIVKIGRAHV